MGESAGSEWRSYRTGGTGIGPVGGTGATYTVLGEDDLDVVQIRL